MNRDLQANEAESKLNTDEKDLYLDPNVTRSFDYQRHSQYGRYSDSHYLQLEALSSEETPSLLGYLKSMSIHSLKLDNTHVSKNIIDAILQSRVRTLTFETCTLKPEILDDFLARQTLAVLQLWEHKISSTMIPRFNMPSLTLKNCQIGPEEAKLFLDMPWLTNLDLSENPLLGNKGVEILSSHSTLEKLTLAYCEINSDGVKAFSGNKTLKALDLSENYVGYQGFCFLLSVPNLTELSLSSRSEIIPTESTAPAINRALKILDVSDSSLGNSGMEALRYCPSLTQIDLSFYKNSSIETDYFLKFQYLKILNLVGIHLTDENVLALSIHPFITELKLGFCNISPTGLGYLSDNPILEKIDLRYNRQLMGDAAVKHFSKFPALTDLNLRNCSIDDKAVAALAKHSGLQNLDLTANLVILSWGIVALALNPNIRKLGLNCEGINQIYLLFFAGNQALEDFIMEGNPVNRDVSNFLFKRNPTLKKQYDKAVEDILLSCLPLPQALVPIVQDYSREYRYDYRLFHISLNTKALRQCAKILPQIEENLPEIKNIIRL